MPIDVKQFDGVDVPQWMTNEQVNGLVSFLNSLHQGGSKGVRFHILHRYNPKVDKNPKLYPDAKPQLYLHLINEHLLPDVPSRQLHKLVINWMLENKMHGKGF